MPKSGISRFDVAENVAVVREDKVSRNAKRRVKGCVDLPSGSAARSRVIDKRSHMKGPPCDCFCFLVAASASSAQAQQAPVTVRKPIQFETGTPSRPAASGFASTASRPVFATRLFAAARRRRLRRRLDRHAGGSHRLVVVDRMSADRRRRLADASRLRAVPWRQAADLGAAMIVADMRSRP